VIRKEKGNKMAQRRTPVEKWLEQALGTDETRPFLLKPAISADDENIRVCTDSHRLHVVSSKLYTAEIKNEWRAPTDFVFKPRKGFKISNKFLRTALVDEINELINQNLNSKLIEQISELNRSSELFSAIKCETHRDTFEEAIKETLATLREYRNPRSMVSLQKWLGINVTLNPLYLLEALNYRLGNYVNLNSDGHELGPVIIEYLDVKLAACIMPMRH
jgi:hypothetical protein